MTGPWPNVPGRLLLILIAAPVAGIVLAVANPPVVPILVALNVGAIALALLLRVSSGPIDLFEPIVVFVAAWAVMFVLRPIGMLAYGDMTLRGTYEVSTGLPAALGLSALGALAFGAAYSIPASRSLAGRLRHRAEAWDPGADVATPIALSCIALSFAGGIAGGAGVSTAYLTYLPLLAVPGSLLLLNRQRSRPSVATLAAIVALAVLLVQAVTIGQRSIVFYVVGSLAILYYTRRNRRPKARTVAIGGAIALLVVVNGLEVLRGTAQPDRPLDVGLTSASDFTPQAAVERLLTGGSTEMLPALALQIQTEGRDWAFTPGYLALAVATHWVPGTAWSGKQPSSDELLYSRFFPSHYAVNKANVQFSTLGGLYFDAGVFGVMLGMFALGVLSRVLGGLLGAAPTSSGARLLYAPFIPLFVVLLRGDVALTLGLALYMYAPLVLALALRRPARFKIPPVPSVSAR